MFRSLLRRSLAALGHLYPLQTGCGKLSRSRLCRWAVSDDDVRQAQLRNGMVLSVPLTEFVGRAVYYFGDLDPKITWVLRRVLRPGDTVLDIGANVGLVSHYAAGLVGPRGRVYAFEPQPRLAALMGESVRANRLSNLQIHNVALGEADAHLDLFIPSHNYGAASLVVEAGATGERVRVPVRAASACLEGLAVDNVRLIKMDVEGYEPAVLRGAAAFIDKVAPHFVLLELNRAGHHGGNDEAVCLLERHGYVFYNIPRRPLVNIIMRSGKENGWTHDVLAVHRSHVVEAERLLPVRTSRARRASVDLVGQPSTSRGHAMPIPAVA